ncbi:MAG: DMT family transporter [Phototrophicaceae bacterium]
MPSHVRSILQALFVTFLWSTSVILIKTGLETLPPLTFAGLRYSLAFVFLLPLALRTSRRGMTARLTRADWRRLIALGLVMYTLTQGAQFVALDYLPPATHSMMLNGTSAVVLVFGTVWLAEHPTRLQIAGIALYFAEADFSGTQMIGLTVATFQVFANAAAAVLGRFVNRTATLSPLLITTISMGVGAAMLIVAALFTQGVPQLGVGEIALIVWLAGINTAFAFTLWNHSQRTLSAMESSMINSTMLIQIGALAWIFLGDALSIREVAGMLLAAAGILLVQVRRLRRAPRPSLTQTTDQPA